MSQVDYEIPVKSNGDNRLTFWLLAFLAAIMTGMGGATASHMVSQSDEILVRIAKIEASIAVEDVYNKDLERRLDNLEKQIYSKGQ